MHKKNRAPEYSKDCPGGYKPTWLAMVLKERYSPMEKSTMKKIMLSDLLIKKLWRRLFR